MILGLMHPTEMNTLEKTKVCKSARPTETEVALEDVRFGGTHFTVIAGPCAVESMEQLLATARAVESAGAKVLRGSIFKPRTSPYSYQGIGPDGVELLKLVKSETSLKVESEVLLPEHLDLLVDHVDMLRVGSRNMDNFELLKEVGKTRLPVILKRNMSATLHEFLMAAEYILNAGNENVILCERGIRTFETYTRNTLDIMAVPALKELTHLPIIVDPSHATGKKSLIGPASQAALAVGADGLIIEVHPDPETAKSDGGQSLTFAEFTQVMTELQATAHAFHKKIS